MAQNLMAFFSPFWLNVSANPETSSFIWFLEKGGLGAIIGSVLGFILGFIGDEARKRLFAPKLDFEFGNDSSLRSFTDKGGERYFYLRGAVKNRSRTVAKGCRVYLTRIDFKNANGRYVRCDHKDSLQLRWSAVPDEERQTSRDIHEGVTQCFDIIYSSSSNPSELIITSAFFPTRYHDIFLTKGTFRLRIMVVSENHAKCEQYIDVCWPLKWDQIKIINK